MANLSKILIGAAICSSSTLAFANSNNLYHQPGFLIGIDGGYGYFSSPEQQYPNDYNNEYDVYNSNSDIGDYVWGAHIGYDFKIKSIIMYKCQNSY